MEYQWIDITQLQGLDRLKIVLFGAGRGAEETLHFIKERKLDLHVCGIVDNDKSLQGKTFFDYPVYSPAELPDREQDVIVVTSISGKESIARQLAGLGFRPGRDFRCIGKYPSGFANSIREIIRFQDTRDLHGKRCLHVGPGGFLGLEMCLYSFGAARVFSVDKFSFGYETSDIGARKVEYLEVRAYLQDASRDRPEAERRVAAYREGERFVYRPKQNQLLPSHRCPVLAV